MKGDDKQALTLQWVYGVSDVPSNIVNLSNEHSKIVAYAAAHTAVVYDKQLGTQTFLQGHCNAITCMQATPDRSLLVTADAGSKPSLLVFWDPAASQPVATVQEPHTGGVLSMAISADGCQLATLSAPQGDQDAVQQVSVWDISSVASSPPSQLQPLSTTPVPAGDLQTWIAFSQQNATQLVTNGCSRVMFWRQQQEQRQPMDVSCPAFRPAEFQQSVGHFLASAFVPNSTQAVTSTVDGDMVVWEQEGLSAAAAALHKGPSGVGRRPLKIIRLHGAAIRHLSCIGDFVVTGGADGLVRFFDSGMRLCAWFEGMNAGPVSCVSFATHGQQQPKAAMHLSTLSAPNFVISTSTGKLVAVDAGSFNTPDPSNPSGSELLVEAPDSGLTHLLAHPLRPELLLLAGPGSGGSTASSNAGSSNAGSSTSNSSDQTGTNKGSAQGSQAAGQGPLQAQRLMRWDLVTRSCVVSRQLPPEQVAVQVAMARDGTFAVLGCKAGHVVVLKGDTLQETVSLRHTKHEVVRITVSTDGRYVACADAVGQVLLYGYLPHKGTYLKWDLVGKFKAHHKEVVGLHFGEAPGGQTRLFSLGADQRLIEYDLASCTSANAGLRALSIRDCVPPGSTGCPTALCFAPPQPYYSHTSLETLLLVADDAYKIKAYNPDGESPVATATYLGPAFGDPINKLLPFRSVSDSGSTPWLAYSTADSVVGLIKWTPLECDPHSSMGLIAHPGRIRGLVLTFDGRKLITLGTNGIMNVWEVNTAALLSPVPPAGAAAASSRKPDWAGLVGDPGLYEELQDYFCYAQLTTQPLDTTGGLTLSGRVPKVALADVMRAAGHYPSEADTEALMAHVKFLSDMAPADDAAVCSTTSGSSGSNGSGLPGTTAAQHTADWVDLDTFLLLYLSHRPVAGFSRQQVEAAFKTLGASRATGVLSSQHLLEMLQTGGERMSSEELQQVLAELTGAESPEAALPEFVDAQTFTTEILGFAA